MVKAKVLAIDIQRIEPKNWFCGMNNKRLQIMLTGHGVRDCDVSVEAEGVRLDSVVRLDSPNYLFVYLDISGAKPGNVVLTLSKNGAVRRIDYPLLEREMTGAGRKGFTNADVLYMLMPDRFAQGNKDNSHADTRFPYTIDRRKPSMRHGGDLNGIRKHLDYFNELGVTTLWLTPVLENDMPEKDGVSSYHGYATTDYYRVDPRFGSNEDYRLLVDEAHAHGLKIVMDMIFNHCGLSHPWVQDPPSNDWFNNPNYGLQTSYKLTPTVDPYASDVDKRECVDGWFVASMPDLNQRNRHLLTYLIQNSIWWIEAIGIDGIRMDTYPYADAKAMAQWMTVINDEYPNFNVVGESWVTEPGFTAALQKDSRLSDFGTGIKGFNTELKTVMDFAFFERINLAKNEETDDWWEGFNRIYNTLVYDFLYPEPKNVLAFLDNHDTDRFLGKGKDVLSLKQGLALLLTMKRIPQIYYGTEILMNGTKSITDGYVRCDFPGGFSKDKHNKFTEKGRTRLENATFQWLSKLLHWRQTSLPVIHGTQKQFIPHNGVYVMHHEFQGRNVMLIINGTSVSATFSHARYAECIPQGTLATEVTTGIKYGIGRHDLTLRPRQTLVLEY